MAPRTAHYGADCRAQPHPHPKLPGAAQARGRNCGAHQPALPDGALEADCAYRSPVQSRGGGSLVSRGGHLPGDFAPRWDEPGRQGVSCRARRRRRRPGAQQIYRRRRRAARCAARESLRHRSRGAGHSRGPGDESRRAPNAHAANAAPGHRIQCLPLGGDTARRSARAAHRKRRSAGEWPGAAEGGSRRWSRSPQAGVVPDARMHGGRLFESERTMTPEAAEKLDKFFAAVRNTPRSILLLDYDGTMAAFRVDRFQAHPFAGVRELLARIQSQPRTRMAIVTGRPAGDIAPLLGLNTPLEVWGLHGAERLYPDGRRELEQASPAAVQRLDDVRALLYRDSFGGHFEDKANAAVM